MNDVKPPPDLVPGLEDFWAPEAETEESIAKMVEGDPHFAHTRRARFGVGVVYQGPWETMHDGVCIAVRRNACALRRAGFPVFLSSLTHTHWNRGFVEKSFHFELPPEVLDEVGHLTDMQHSKTIARIVHFVPTTNFLAEQDRPSIAGADVKDVMLTRTMAYMALEYDHFPEYWVHVWNKFGRILVPCEKNKRDLEAAGVKAAIDVIPHPMAFRDPMGKVRTSYSPFAGGSDNIVRFLHVGKWEPRKNQHMMIGGFLHAFEPGQGSPTLTIHSKPFWGVEGYPCTPEESRYQWLQDEDVKANGWTQESYDKHILVNWNELKTRQEMADMYAAHHVYVSPGRAEGFDLCAFDGKVAGHLMVYVPNGGPEDFATDTDVRVMVDVASRPPKQYNAPKGVMWPDPTAAEYAHAFQNAVEKIATSLTPFDRRPYRLDAVGKKLAASVLALARDHDLDVERLDSEHEGK
jgi:glycosyltransferase involved in cell wall biosynthesis